MVVPNEVQHTMYYQKCQLMFKAPASLFCLTLGLRV